MSTATAIVQEESDSLLKRLAASPGWLLVAAGAVWIYARVLADLAKEWWINPDYSHGLLIPFAIGYLLYEKRAALEALPLRPSWFGLLVIVASQCINIVGFLGAEFFLQRTSFVLLIVGLVLYFGGWQYLRETAFMLLLFELAIPLPVLIFNLVALPLQLIASSWAESFLRVCQIPVLREGNLLVLSQQTLNVTEACSGIRSLMSLITLGLMLAYFLPFRWMIRVAFVLTTIPIAIIANAFRVGGTGVLATYFGEKAAQGFFHTFSGWLVFVFAFFVLLAEVALLHRIFGEAKQGGPHAAK
jgi:exosortase